MVPRRFKRLRWSEGVQGAETIPASNINRKCLRPHFDAQEIETFLVAHLAIVPKAFHFRYIVIPIIMNMRSLYVAHASPSTGIFVMSTIT